MGFPREVFGSTVLLLYINDLEKVVKDFRVSFFADDTRVLKKSAVLRIARCCRLTCTLLLNGLTAIT